MSLPVFILGSILVALWLLGVQRFKAWRRNCRAFAARMRSRLNKRVRPGIVYLVRYGRSDGSVVYKVGFTGDLKTRMADLKRKQNRGVKITIICLWLNVPMAEGVERGFHASKFAKSLRFHPSKDNLWGQSLGVEQYFLKDMAVVESVIREITRRVGWMRDDLVRYDAKRIMKVGKWTPANDQEVTIRRYASDGSFSEIKPFAKAA